MKFLTFVTCLFLGGEIANFIYHAVYPNGLTMEGHSLGGISSFFEKQVVYLYGLVLGSFFYMVTMFFIKKNVSDRVFYNVILDIFDLDKIMGDWNDHRFSKFGVARDILNKCGSFLLFYVSILIVSNIFIMIFALSMDPKIQLFLDQVDKLSLEQRLYIFSEIDRIFAFIHKISEYYWREDIQYFAFLSYISSEGLAVMLIFFRIGVERLKSPFLFINYPAKMRRQFFSFIYINIYLFFIIMSFSIISVCANYSLTKFQQKNIEEIIDAYPRQDGNTKYYVYLLKIKKSIDNKIKDFQIIPAFFIEVYHNILWYPFYLLPLAIIGFWRGSYFSVYHKFRMLEGDAIIAKFDDPISIIKEPPLFQSEITEIFFAYPYSNIIIIEYAKKEDQYKIIPKEKFKTEHKNEG